MITKTLTTAILVFGMNSTVSDIKSDTDVGYDSMQVYCLAKNMYYEARGEGIENMKVVGLITMERSRQRGLSVCRTVYEWNQFSWTRGDLKLKQPSGSTFEKIKRLAWQIYRGEYVLANKYKCLQYYKRTDDRGVSDTSKKFFNKLVIKATFGNHTAYCER